MRRQLIAVLAVLALAGALSAGCSDPLNEANSVGGGFVPQALGMNVCYDCHKSTAFPEWMQSRHANLDYYNYSTRAYGRLDPLDSNSYLHTVQGYPGAYWTTYHYYTGCYPCHGGADNGGDILDQNVNNVLFPDPKIGWPRRFLIDCEGCHVSGAGHMGAAQPPAVPVPALVECGDCHGIGSHPDHHDPASYRSWLNGSGLTPGSANAPIQTVLSYGTKVVDAWVLPSVLPSPSWAGTYNGPYFYYYGRTIQDTHLNATWLINESDKVTVWTPNVGRLGYLDLTNTSPNTGMVRGDSEDACTASCHKPHMFDLAVNDQWAHGGHHPVAGGPVVPYRTWYEPSVPVNWHAVDYTGLGVSCVRCHSSIGFVEKNLQWGLTSKSPTGGGFITCNACHDGVTYPEASNNFALRHSGRVALYTYTGAVIDYATAGAGAACTYCHQGVEDGTHLAADAASFVASNLAGYIASTRSNPVVFRNSHYLAAGAILNGAKGYEYPGHTYSGPFVHSNIQGTCAYCHMAEAPSEAMSEEVGGHTFRVAEGGTENTTSCLPCHSDMVSFEDVGALAHTSNWDGDAATMSAKDEIAELLSVTLSAIETFDANADGMQDVYHIASHPYFRLYHQNMDGTINTARPRQAWTPATAEAAFNWNLVYKEPGAYAHNPDYAVQLLRDSYDDLDARQPPGAADIPALGGVRP